MPRTVADPLIQVVLRDWPDEQCFAILACCQTTMAGGTRLFVVERLFELPLQPTADDCACALSDLNMLLAHGACEHTEHDFYALLDKAGFKQVAIHRVTMGLAAIEACASR